jgi:hypothetical protein
LPSLLLLVHTLITIWKGQRKEITISPCPLLLSGYLAFTSTLKMEAVCSFETSLNFYRTTRRYIFIDTAVRTLNPTNRRIFLQCWFAKTPNVHPTGLRFTLASFHT